MIFFLGIGFSCVVSLMQAGWGGGAYVLITVVGLFSQQLLKN